MSHSIAIVGIGCRFPGGVDSPESFWKLLHHQVDAISEVPVNRWQASNYYSSDSTAPGKMVTRWGGFLDQVDRFDAQFFRISPREAVELDPQQRLLLEVTWEALEHAGIVPAQLKKSRTGVFIGACSTDYFKLRTKFELRDTFNGYSYTGGRPSLLAGRLAYTFDFQGPTMVVDTACSSSLVALHLACQALNNHEADASLVGGVNVLLDPGVFILASKLGTQSITGRCQAFDDRADGFVRSEGCGILVLKRLKDALQDGSRILAVVRGTGVNQDGNSSSITAPDAQAQAKLMRQVLAGTNLSPTDITYVEAHGTGTPVGDPVEFSSIWEVFGQSHQAQGRQLPVGSVKTNIGHCEAASGIASVIKTVLALQHQEIPANLHFQRLNPAIPAEAANMVVPTSSIPWKTLGSKRYAAINSFGFSGTNAHLILEEAELCKRSAPDQNSSTPMLCLSAPSTQALKEQAQLYQKYLKVNLFPLEVVCQAVNTRRTHFRYRHGFTGQTVEHLQQSLSNFITAKEPTKKSSNLELPKVAFLFTGQGSQYVQMGQQLMASNDVFRKTMETCDRILKSHLGESLLETIYSTNLSDAEHKLQQTNLAQPAIFALEYSLYQTWKFWGITPDIVLGHSVGEYVAACISGLFSLEQGLILMATRGRLMQALPANGAMAAVTATLETIQACLGHSLPETVSVAAVNAPDQTVLSGDAETLEGILQILEQQEVMVRRLSVSQGFHSALLEPMLAPLRQALEQIEFGSLQIPLVSNLTGQQISSQAIALTEYWLAHTRQAVQFEASMHTLETAGVQIFVEIGPRPTLINLGQRCLSDSTATWLMSLRPKFNDTQVMAESLVKLYGQGIDPNWQALYPDRSYPMIALPTYPFQRKRYWSDFAHPESDRTAYPTSPIPFKEQPIHPLLGHQGQVGFTGQTYFQQDLSPERPAFLADHQVKQTVIFPGAAYVEMALAAGRELYGQSPFIIANLHLKMAMSLTSESPRRVQMLLNHRPDKLEFEVVSAPVSVVGPDEEWTRHVAGELYPQVSSLQESPDLQYVRSRFNQSRTPQAYYKELALTGLNYGPSFQGIQELWVTEAQTEALARIQLPATIQTEETDYYLHPVLLDGCSQIARWADGSKIHHLAKVPFFFENISVYGNIGDRIWCYARRSATAKAGERNPAVDLFLYNLQGEPVATIEGLHRYTYEQLAEAKVDNKSWAQDAYQTQWQPQPLITSQISESQPTIPLEGMTILLLPCEASKWTERVVAHLVDRAEVVVQVFLGTTFTARSSCEYEVSSESIADFRSLLDALDRAALPPLKRILHLGHIHSEQLQPSALESFPSALVARSCSSTLHLIQALSSRESYVSCDLWLVNCGSQRVMSKSARVVDVTGAPLWGLGRVIRSEHPELNCRQIDLDPWDLESAGIALLAELENTNGEEEVAYRDKQRWVPRLMRADLSHLPASGLSFEEGESLRLDIATRGLLDSLELKAEVRSAPAPGEVEVEVVAAGLNFRDVLNALGTYKGKPGPLGGEFSGRVVRVGQGVDASWIGKRVLGLTTGSFSRYVTAHHQVIAELPESLSFEQGAAIPITFLTAYQTLYQIGNIKAGDRVLIHAGAGGVGLAAIQLAQRAGAEVFATAGSEKKRALLRSLGVPHVMNSRTTDFSDEIQTITSGGGIDLVLNSLTGDFISKGLSLVRPGGKFIELGKAELWNDDQLAKVAPDIHYIPYYLGDYRDNEPELVQSMFKALLDLFTQGDLQVLYRAFPIQQAKEVFRLMQRGGHIGKLVLTFCQVRPQDQIDPEGTYLLTGGLGGIGLQLTQRLADRGARHLVLLSRRGRTQLRDGSDSAERVNAILQSLEQQGVQIEIMQADVASQSELAQVIKEIQTKMPPLRGIFHAAGALEDGLLLGQDWARFQKGLAAKVEGAWNLHRLTLDAELDCFVMFSSVTSLLGPAARGPYAAGNLFLDRMADYRHQMGLPSLSVNWGAWADTGMAKEIRSQRADLQRLQMLPPEAGLDCLEQLMAQEVYQIGIFPLDWQEFQKRFSGDRVPKYFENLVSEALQSSQANTQHSTVLSSESVQPAIDQALQQSLLPKTLLQSLSTVSLEQRAGTLQSGLVKGISNLLGLDDETGLEPNLPLEQYGLDSLMTVELRNWLLKELQVKVPVVKLSKHITVIDLTHLLLQELPEELPNAVVQVSSSTMPSFSIQPQKQIGLTSTSDKRIFLTNYSPVPAPAPKSIKQILTTLPSEDWEPFLQQSLTDNISTMLGMDADAELEPIQPLEIYGLDSLMTIELKNWLLKELSINLPVVKLGKSLSIKGLLQLILEAMPIPPVTSNAIPDAPPSKTPNSVKPSISVSSSGKSTAPDEDFDPSSDNRYSLLFKLRELIYERTDDDLTSLQRLIRDSVRQVSGIQGVEQIIEDYCSQQRTDETLQQSCMRRLNLNLDYDESCLNYIPKAGATVIVANHPFGFIDGAIAEYLVSLRRSDFKVLSAPFGKANRFPARERFLLPLDAKIILMGEMSENDVSTMKSAIEYVQQGGALVIFPAGMVSLSRNWSGQHAVDRPWQPFVAQVVAKSKATVVPIYFDGQNSRLFQILNKIGGMMAFAAFVSREQLSKVNSNITFHIGSPLPYESLSHFKDYRSLTRYLQFMTYELKRELGQPL